MRKPRVGGVLERLFDRGLTDEQIRSVDFVVLLPARPVAFVSPPVVVVSDAVCISEGDAADRAPAIVSARRPSHFPLVAADESATACTPACPVTAAVLLDAAVSSSAAPSTSAFLSELVILHYLAFSDHSSTAVGSAVCLLLRH